MIGCLNMNSASRMATELWVKAAGLMMRPQAAPGPSMPSWIQSMISASLLDWWKAMLWPRPAARVRHISSTSASVVAP